MKSLARLDEHSFVREVLIEGRKLLPEIDVDPDATELPADVELNEQQFYVHRVGFFLVHMLTWCKQLDLAIEFLSNFDYSKKVNASRADHAIYNIENYLIRVNALYDRILQLVNAVFHICISDENVGHSVIISNLKVQHRPDAVKRIKAVRKYLDEYAQARHTIVHKHALLDPKMRRIELFYMNNLDDLPENDAWKEKLRLFRARQLKEFIAEKKVEFSEVNEGLVEKIDDLFGSMNSEYKRQVMILGRAIEL